MNYQRIYDELITVRKENIPSGYSERHHIQMRSLGGSDEESNLVRLTAREHYIAHLLLARFNRCSQTAYALWMMQRKSETNLGREINKSSLLYEWARIEFGKHISKVHIELWNDPAYRERQLKTFRRAQSDSYLNGRVNGFLGKVHSKETREKIGSANSVKQLGSGNSQFGSMWITDRVSNKKISRDDPIPQGWTKGRV